VLEKGNRAAPIAKAPARRARVAAG
jgi:hypothetical protein